MKRAIHLGSLVLAWGFVLALICTIIREAKGDTFLVPEGYLSGYLFYAAVFWFVSYETRSVKVSPPAPSPDGPPESN